MSSKELKKFEVDLSDWFAVCDVDGNAQAIFPNENLAVWYLNKEGWSEWTIRQIIEKKNEDLFLLKEQHGGADDDKN